MSQREAQIAKPSNPIATRTAPGKAPLAPLSGVSSANQAIASKAIIHPEKDHIIGSANRHGDICAA